MIDSIIEQICGYYKAADQSTYIEGGYFKIRPKIIADITVFFADSGVYTRQGSPVFTGKATIVDFFRTMRPLVGTHTLEKVKVSEGRIDLHGHTIPPQFSHIPASECSTITVHGSFAGKLYTTDGADKKTHSRRIRQEHDASLMFCDHWIAHKGQALYRLSEITPARKVSRVLSEKAR